MSEINLKLTVITATNLLAIISETSEKMDRQDVFDILIRAPKVSDNPEEEIGAFLNEIVFTGLEEDIPYPSIIPTLIPNTYWFYDGRSANLITLNDEIVEK